MADLVACWHGVGVSWSGSVMSGGGCSGLVGVGLRDRAWGGQTRTDAVIERAGFGVVSSWVRWSMAGQRI